MPQGSILGLLLFIIYINDLVHILTEMNAKLYADDTAIVGSSQSFIELVLMLRIEMANVVEWLRLNKLTLNVKKTKMKIFWTPHKLKGETNMPLHINNEVVENVNVFKYLGVYLDKNLNFEYHIECIYKKTCSKVGLLKRSAIISTTPQH